MKTKQYTLNETLAFGKYRGKTLRQVLTQDANYVQWCLGNVQNFSMDCPAWDYAISLSSAFETYKPKSTTMVAKRDSLPYSDGIEVLLYNPWGDKILMYASSVAIDVMPIVEKVPCLKPAGRQLEIAFV